uniref:Glycosyltransferase n=1 Tax=viral metagenome TaxID=1070528 RepID=A0A6C0HMH5_9ZZZZ
MANITSNAKKYTAHTQEYINKRITGDAAYKLLYNTIQGTLQGTTPLFIGKIGSVELRTIIESILISKGIIADYSDGIKYEACNCAGLYPNNKVNFINFMSIYLEAMRHINIMASWNDNIIEVEETIWNDYALSQKGDENRVKLLIDLPALEPFYTTPDNWWQHLYQNKTILVISPFTKSIQQQLANRDKVWQGRWTNFWPSNITFKFINFPHPYFLLSEQEKINMPTNSLDLLTKYKGKIANCGEFDLALIGIGAYSIPLASYIKGQMLKTAIHLGGGLQMMFGVAGSRWKESNNPFFKEYINEHWISPLAEEIPPGYKHQENGCYF